MNNITKACWEKKISNSGEKDEQALSTTVRPKEKIPFEAWR